MINRQICQVCWQSSLHDPIYQEGHPTLLPAQFNNLCDMQKYSPWVFQKLDCSLMADLVTATEHIPWDHTGAAHLIQWNGPYTLNKILILI
jgi:hypothetical protein